MEREAREALEAQVRLLHEHSEELQLQIWGLQSDLKADQELSASRVALLYQFMHSLVARLGQLFTLCWVGSLLVDGLQDSSVAGKGFQACRSLPEGPMPLT